MGISAAGSTTRILTRLGVVAVAALLALTGCSKKEPTTAAPPPTTGAPTETGTPPPSGPASATPSGSPNSVIEFTVDGAGPYQLGATMTALQAAGLDSVTKGGSGCPDNTTAQGTGVWNGVQLSFRKSGELYLLVNKSASVPTPSGAWLGTTLPALKKIYANIQGQQLSHGGKSAYLVTTLSGRGILFELDAGQKVSSMAASDADYLRATFASGAAFC